jgi:NAD-dependent dihydropyrimidine dehydrogenase PreA subunit
MTYVITEPCIGTKDQPCVEVCPVDCIYDGGDQLLINPEECRDCGACEPECPVEVIYPEDEVRSQRKWSPTSPRTPTSSSNHRGRFA